MSVIHTKYLGPTNHRGSRIRATLAEGWGIKTLTLNYDPALTSLANHKAAAQALADKLGLLGKWYRYSGANCYVFVRAEIVDLAFTTHKQEA